MSDDTVQSAPKMPGIPGLGGGVLPFQPPDKQSLYLSYMPFIKGGGLYIPTNRKYSMGHEVFILVKLPESSERHPAVGKVVWVNRAGTVNRPAGIGVQLPDTPENAAIRDLIERALLGMSQDQPTYTM